MAAPEITEVTKKKWASQKCTLAEYRQAGGWPNIISSSSAGGSDSPTNDSPTNDSPTNDGEGN